MKKNYFDIFYRVALFFISPLLFASLSCNDNPTNHDEIKPGRRDYTWTVDTLAGLNSPRFRMWGSSPTDIWATTTSNWDVSISHYNGIKWTSYGIPNIIQPNAIYGFSSNNIFVGDENGKIWKYDGASWKLSTQLKKAGTVYFLFENIWGELPNDLYAIGSGPDDAGYFNRSIIAHYVNDVWTIVISDSLKGDVVHLYKNKPDNKIYFQLIRIGGILHVDSTIIFEYEQGKCRSIYSSLEEKGLKSDISLINNEVYFILGNEIATRINGKFQKVLDVNNPNFYQRIWGRNSKDIFLLMTDGLAHYNGNDIEYLFYFNVTPRTQIYGAALFKNDAFFLVDEAQTGLSLIYHGKLK